jgi:phosphoserine phosphatase
MRDLNGPGVRRAFLVTVTGPDHPGISERLFTSLESVAVTLVDVEQVQVHGQLLLCAELTADPASSVDASLIRRSIESGFGASPDSSAGPSGLGLAVRVSDLEADDVRYAMRGADHTVTVLAPELGAGAMAGVCTRIAACGGNIDRIVRLSRFPVTSYELVVTGGDPARLRRELGAEAVSRSVDVAVQRAGLHRRAKHLIVLDADSTLFQGEVIDLLATRAGCAAEVAKVTEAAMSGTMDFGKAMEMRLSLLAGLDAGVLDQVVADLRLAPGARTLIRTLKRLGYVTAVVSGGFTGVVAPIADELGIDHVAANTLEVVDGRVTGRLVGPLIDRAGKADALRRFAAAADVPLMQTVAVGDGANDLDMLALAGLGIAFNARPVVRDAADMSLNVPYLDAILFLLGISRDEIEAADTVE